MSDFFEEILKILEIPEEKRQEVRQSFREIVFSDLLLSFNNELTDEKKKELRELLGGQIDNEKFKLWFKENFPVIGEEGLKRVDEAVKKAINEFLDVLFKDLSLEKKQKILELTKEEKL